MMRFKRLFLVEWYLSITFDFKLRGGDVVRLK